jgi:hypothetical protein
MSVLINNSVFGIGQQVFTTQDAVVPGLNLNLISGTDAPSTLSSVTGGQKLWTSYDKDTPVSQYNAHVRADVYLNFGDIPTEIIGVYNTTVQTYFNPTFWQGVQSDPTNTFLRYETLGNSYTYAYHGNTPSFLTYYSCIAQKIVYDPNHPNFSYEIDIHGAFGSDADVLSLLDLLANHCATVIASKQISTSNTPSIILSFADGTSSGHVGDTVTVKGSNWTPNTPVVLTGAFNPYTKTIRANQVDSQGNWSTTAVTSNAIEPADYTITATQGTLSATCQMTIIATNTNANPNTCVTIITSVIGPNAYVKQGDLGSWIPAQAGMAIGVDYQIKATTPVPGVIQSVEVKVYPPNTQTPVPSSETPLLTMNLRSGNVKFIKNEFLSATKVQCTFDATPIDTNNMNTNLRVLTMPRLGIDRDNMILLYHALYHDIDTDFELIGNASQTTVYTFEGNVEVSDDQNITTVEVAANHAETATTSGIISQPTSFDPTSIDRWWIITPTSTITSTLTNTPKPTGSTNNTISIGNMLPVLTVIAAVILAIIVAIVVLRKKRPKNITQENYPPPPPPPPDNF